MSLAWKRLQTHMPTPSALASLGLRQSMDSRGTQELSKKEKMMACLPECASLIMLDQMDKAWTVPTRNLMGEAASQQVGDNKDPELCYHRQEVQAVFSFTPSFLGVTINLIYAKNKWDQ